MKKIILLTLFVASYASAQYVMTKSTISSAGNSASSANYILKDAAGQSIAGESKSATRIEQAGFYTYGTKTTVGIQELPITPKVFSLSQPFPNPVTKGIANIKYAVPRTSNVNVRIYNVTGRAIKTIANGEKVPGMYNFVWNGSSDNGEKVAQGVYFVRMIAPEYKATKKLIFVK